MSRVWTWRQAIWESSLQATTKLVLQALASHLNDMGGPMFPSQERLSKLCSLSERAVITHLQIAEEACWICARKRELRGAKWAANEYVARFPDGVNDVHPRGEAGSPSGVKDVHTNSPSEHPRNPTPIAPKGAEPVNGAFEDFWKEYPNKVGKPVALKAFERAKPDSAALMAGLAAWKSSPGWQKDKGRFIPHPTTFLNQRRWEDVPVELAAKTETEAMNDAAWDRITGNNQQKQIA